MQGVGVDQKIGASFPTDLAFVDELGKPVKLGDYFASGKRPVVVQLGYFTCPMLCDIVSEKLINSFSPLTLKAGQDYEFVYISIDPTETPQAALIKKRNFVQSYGRTNEANGFHFLTGRNADIKQVAAAVGWRYKWIEDARQYSHPGAIMVIGPDAKVNRYLFMGQPGDPQVIDERTLRLSIVEASAGKVGSIFDAFILTCFQYDAHTGKYTMAAVNLMRLGGVLMILIVGGWLLIHFGRELKNAKSQPPATPT
jgi:protein SCO1/2